MPLRSRVEDGLGDRENGVREALVTLRTVLDEIRQNSVNRSKH